MYITALWYGTLKKGQYVTMQVARIPGSVDLEDCRRVVEIKPFGEDRCQHGDQGLGIEILGCDGCDNVECRLS